MFQRLRRRHPGWGQYARVGQDRTAAEFGAESGAESDAEPDAEPDGATGGGKMVSELAHDTVLVAERSFDVFETATTRAAPLVLQFAVPLAIFVGVGFSLVVLRIELIKGAPYIASHSRKFAVLANGVDKILDAALDAVKGTIFVVRFLLSLASPHRAKPEVPTWAWPTTNITADEVVSFADAITACSDTKTTAAVKYITQYAGNAAVCPLLRAATPLRGINTTLLPAFDWLAFNYTPGAQDPATGLGNCRLPEDYRDAVCAGLQSGHILLEIMIPVAIGVLVFVTLLAPVFMLTVAAGKLQWTIALDTLHLLKKL